MRFSLIEIFLTGAILIILVMIVVLAIKSPVDTEAGARNEARRRDVTNIMNAVYSYALDHKGVFPKSITSMETEICRSKAALCRNGVDLAVLTNVYINTLPLDPQTPGSGTGTLYTIRKEKDGRITVIAPKAEGGVVISETR